MYFIGKERSKNVYNLFFYYKSLKNYSGTKEEALKPVLNTATFVVRKLQLSTITKWER